MSVDTFPLDLPNYQSQSRSILGWSLVYYTRDYQTSDGRMALHPFPPHSNLYAGQDYGLGLRRALDSCPCGRFHFFLRPHFTGLGIGIDRDLDRPDSSKKAIAIAAHTSMTTAHAMRSRIAPKRYTATATTRTSTMVTPSMYSAGMPKPRRSIDDRDTPVFVRRRIFV
jgi:hypothetical protein